MKKQILIAVCTVSALCLGVSDLQAAKLKKHFKTEEDADNYLTMHYNLGCKHYNAKEWRSAANEFEKVIYFFPSNDAAADAAYYLAVCYFEMKEYDFANREFSNYLKASNHPAFFEDAVYFKFCIAEHFKAGKKKRPMEMRYLPKWVSAHELALTIYDEVVAALPNHELTIQALYSKADLLYRMGEYRDCIDTYQTIIRRFPKNEIVPICYLNIAEAYYQQSRYEFQNPDILALAELNLRKFKDEFPRDDRVEIAESSFCRIKELYAKGLCDLGLFYERMEHPEAAAIYYQSSIEEFPDTHVAEFCYSRLVRLGYGDIKEESSSNSEEGNSCSATSESCATEMNSCEEKPKSCVNQPDSSLEAAISSSEDSDSSGNEVNSCLGELNSCINEVDSANALAVNSQKNTTAIEELSLPAEEAPYQEYPHYSLIKKKQTSHVAFEPVEQYSEEVPETAYLEGGMPEPFVDDPQLEEGAPFLKHYSQLKHRDQKYVTPQE